jgi:GNAT superfamily N-acetyltransferase
MSVEPTGRAGSAPPEDLTVPATFSVRTADRAPWADLQTVFGGAGDPGRCWCQWFKADREDYRSAGPDELADRLRRQTGCTDPVARTTTGLVAYLGEEPVGWCAVEPRTAYPRLATARIPWSGRSEDRQDAGVWAITCFVTRTGFRRRGVSRALVDAAVRHARAGGAHAVEGYPVAEPSSRARPDELFVGVRSVFAAAGFAEVARPTAHRVVMRLEL